MFRLAISLSVVCCVLALTNHVFAQCRYDAECLGIRQCTAGKCVPIACGEDRDCPANAHCDSGGFCAPGPPAIAPPPPTAPAPDPFSLPPAPAVQYESFSTPMVIGGAVALAAGATTLVAGIATFASAETEVHCSQGVCEEQDVGTVLGGSLIGIGSATVITGAILVAFGARKVRLDPPAEALRIQPFIGPRGIGIKTVF